MPRPTDRNTDFSILYAMLAFLVIICVNVLSKCVVQPMMNDVSQKMELQELETAFNTVQHPDQTERVDMQKAIGLLTDQSESCDIFIGEIRSYGGERDQISAAYAGQTVKGYGEPGVIFIEDKIIPAADNLSLPSMFSSLSQWNIDPATLEKPLYLVYIFLPDYDSKANVKCR
jgi:hypothetical protein